jgi:hypothetical protein
MKKTVLTFGLISGALSAALLLVTIPFADKIGFDKGEILGYTGIVLSALMVFFGIRSYRENIGGGRLTFGRGLAIGLLITAISSTCYVGTWEIVYYKFMPDFSDNMPRTWWSTRRRPGQARKRLSRRSGRHRSLSRCMPIH